MDAYTGEIRIVGFQFAARAWANCDHQLLPIAQNSALFSILGTIYGGDGRSTFALPQLQSRTTIHSGTGPGLSTRNLGNLGGSEQVQLNISEIPSHNHGFFTDDEVGNSATPANGYQADFTENNFQEFTDVQPTQGQFFNDNMVGDNVGGQPHSNIQPFQTLRYLCCLNGLYPSRS